MCAYILRSFFDQATNDLYIKNHINIAVSRSIPKGAVPFLNHFATLCFTLNAAGRSQQNAHAPL